MGDTLSALGSVVGGIIGALGAALAVILTLSGQRRDETEKINTAIITEIAQLARFPVEQLRFVTEVYSGHLDVPRKDLPIVTQMPPPPLYLTAAERISRVHRPTLVVAFYMGLAESERVVNVIVKTPSPLPSLTPTDVEGLGVMLVEQCFLARQILSNAPLPEGRERAFAAQMLDEIVRRLDEQLAKSRALFPSTRNMKTQLNSANSS